MTGRLIGAESDESGEALMYAAIYLRALFTGTGVVASDEEFDELSSRVQIILIMESLQRHGYVRVTYENSVVDPLACDAPVRVIGTWPASVRNGDPGNGCME